MTKKNIISLLLLAILVVAIPLGVKLAREQQILKSKAAAVDPIKFSGAGVDCAKGDCVTTSPTFDVEVTSPLGPPKP